jgi:hypothetical protein
MVRQSVTVAYDHPGGGLYPATLPSWIASANDDPGIWEIREDGRFIVHAFVEWLAPLVDGYYRVGLVAGPHGVERLYHVADGSAYNSLPMDLGGMPIALSAGDWVWVQVYNHTSSSVSLEMTHPCGLHIGKIG